MTDHLDIRLLALAGERAYGAQPVRLDDVAGHGMGARAGRRHCDEMCRAAAAAGAGCNY